MLETSIFLLYFPYVKACQCCRFFNVTNQKQTNKKKFPLFWLLSFDEALHKNAKELTKGASPKPTHRFWHSWWRKKLSIHFPGSSAGALPFPWQVFSTPKSDYILQTGVTLNKRMPPKSQWDENCTKFCWIAFPMSFIQMFPRLGRSLLCLWDGSLGCSRSSHLGNGQV